MDLEKINWEAVAAHDFRPPIIKEGKQAEFLLHEAFPWTQIERVGVIDDDTREKVRAILDGAEHQPEVVVESDWYY